MSGEVVRVAACDCGTNTLRLLIADIDRRTGEATQVERRSTIVRLGQDVDRTGVFAPDALARVFATLDDYARIVAGAGVRATRFVATSAARDVANRDEFLTGVEQRLGVVPEVISGDEEALLTYDGATRQFAGRDDVVWPVLVVDIGGGSTELVLGEGPVRSSDRGSLRSVSLDIGSVRLTERHIRTDPPSDGEVTRLLADVDEALDSVEFPVSGAQTMVAVAGSATTMGAMVLGLTRYDREKVHLARLPGDDLARDVQRIVGMTIEQRMSLEFMQPDRADVIGAGALVLLRVMRRAELDEVVVSARDILDGLAWSLVRVSLPHPLTGRRFPSPVLPGHGWPDDPADPATPRASNADDVARLAAASADLAEVDAQVSVCRACPRLVEWRERVAVEKRAGFADQPYWGRPIAGWGSVAPAILIVGLAPAAHGGNRTGRIFTGDRSGDWLFAALHRVGLATQPTSTHAGDGQRPIGTRMAAAVRCAPPANKPTPVERDTCAPWLDAELGFLLPTLRVVVCLGSFGWEATWRALGRVGYRAPRPRPRFGHAAEAQARFEGRSPARDAGAAGELTVLASYHPSQQNTFTGTLTEQMLDAVLLRAASLAELSA